jgi:hypothetical protein
LNVLGKPWSKGNWRLSTTHNSNKEKKITDHGMPNTNVRQFMDAFDQLADIFLWYDEERKEQWKKSMEHWRKMMEMAGNIKLGHHHVEVCIFKDDINYTAGCWSWRENRT